MVKFKGLAVGLNQISGIDLSAVASLSIICVFLFLIHVVFQIEFHCTCTHGQMQHCWIFMVGPAILIGLVTLLADKRFLRVCGFTCSRCKCSKICCHFCCKLVLFASKAIFSGLVWVVSLLLDGDWYACCYNSLPSYESMVPCKGKVELNFTEQMALDEQKNTSMMYGFLISSVMVVVVFVSTCQCRYQCCGSSCCCSNHYQDRFEEKLLEDAEIIFDKKLKNISEGYITEKIHCNPKLQVLKYVKETDNPGTSGADNPGTSGAASPGTSGDTSVTRGANCTTDLVKNVTTIDWEELSNMYFHLMDELHKEVANTPADTTEKPFVVESLPMTYGSCQDNKGAAGAGAEEETAPGQSGGETSNLNIRSTRNPSSSNEESIPLLPLSPSLSHEHR